MEYLTSGRSNQTYGRGAPLPILGEGFYRGFNGAQELTLRCVPADDATAVAGLRAEAALLERLAHPQIVTVCDRGRSAGQFFIVLAERAERPLAELVQQTEFALTAALAIAVQAAEILVALHAAGVVWGRMRPHAFWVDKAGKLKLCNLRDAGEPVGANGLTLAEATYLAPELGAGQTPSAQGDVYACGALAYEVLAGHPPFEGTSPTELAVRHLSDPAPSLAALRPNLSADLVALIGRCLSKNPDERPASAEALRAELTAIHERLLEEERARLITCPRCASQVLPAERCPLCNAPLQAAAAPPPPPRRKRWPFIAIGAALLILLVALINSQSGAPATAAGLPTPTTTSATSSPAATAAAAATQAPIPTGTVAGPAPGTLSAPARDVADANIDLIGGRVSRDASGTQCELVVVGRAEGAPGERTYQVFFDTDGSANGDRNAGWGDFGADYAVLYRSGDEGAMALRWDGSAWKSVGAATVTRNGPRLVIALPAGALPAAGALRYGIVATNPGSNLADYLPARGGAPATVGE